MIVRPRPRPAIAAMQKPVKNPVSDVYIQMKILLMQGHVHVLVQMHVNACTLYMYMHAVYDCTCT